MELAIDVRNIWEDYKKENNHLMVSFIKQALKLCVNAKFGLSDINLYQEGISYAHSVFSNLTHFTDFIECLLFTVNEDSQRKSIKHFTKASDLIDQAAHMFDKIIG